MRGARRTGREGGPGMNYNMFRFGDFASFKYGKMPNKKRITEKGDYPIYSGYRYTGFYDEYNTEANQLVIVARGVGGTGDVKLTKERCYLTNLSIVANIDKLVALPEYLYYYFSLSNLRYLDSGSAQSQITISDLEKVRIPLPELRLQKCICAILKSLDDKIELNNRINENLEQQAQSLFKSWFVDFEPWGGVMPTDWTISIVDEIIELHDYKRIPLSNKERSKMEKIYPYYGAASLMDYVDNYIFDGIYLLLGEDGTVIDDKGFPILQYVDGKFWVNNHAHIMTGKNGFSVETLFLFFSMTNIKGIVTGAVQPKVSQASLKRVPAIIPIRPILKQFDDNIQPIFAQIRNLRLENLTLSKVRDTLLPRLLSGSLDVSELELS